MFVRKAAGVLRASLKGTKAMKQARHTANIRSDSAQILLPEAKRDVDPNADLKPVQELQDAMKFHEFYGARGRLQSLSILTCSSPSRTRSPQSHVYARDSRKQGSQVSLASARSRFWPRKAAQGVPLLQ